jgi:hypothetical protein
VRITYQQKHTDDIAAADHADLASKIAKASLDEKDMKIEAGEDK